MFKHAHIHLAALAALLLTTSVSCAETLTINDISAGIPGVFELNIPSIEIVDGNVTEAQVRALFEMGIPDKDGVLESLEAESITVPTWSWSFTLPEGQTVIEGEVSGEGSALSLTSIKGGVIGTVVDVGHVVTYPEGGELISNRLELADVDLPRLLRFFGLTSRQADVTPQQIYSHLSYDGYTSKSLSESCSISALTTGALNARPFKMSLVDMMVVQHKLSSGTPVDSLTLSKFYADFLTGFEVGPWAMSDRDCSYIVAGKEIRSSAANMSGEGFSNGVMKAMTADNVTQSMDEDYVFTAGKLKMEAMDFSALPDVFSDALTMIDAKWMAENLRKFMPHFSGFSAENLAIDFADSTKPTDRTHIDIASMDLVLGAYQNGIPTDIYHKMTGMKFPVPETGTESQYLRDLGLKEVELSYLIDMKWYENNSIIVVNGLSFSTRDLGTIALSGTIGHASAALFSNNTSTAILAATSLTALDAQLEFIDEGLNRRALEYVAGVEGKTPEDKLKSHISTVEMMLPTVLGDNASTAEIVTAFVKYLNGHPNLILTAKSNDPAGVTLPELMAAERNPLSLLSKVTLGASNPGDMDDGGKAAANTSP